MKKSHRKDVILARIIFGMLLLIVIAIIVGVVIAVTNHNRVQEALDNKDTTSTTTTNEYVHVPDNTAGTESTEVATETESTETDSTETSSAWAGGNVNLREKASKTADVLLVVPENSELTLIDESPANGFYHVEYEGKEGYIAEDYILLEDPNK